MAEDEEVLASPAEEEAPGALKHAFPYCGRIEGAEHRAINAMQLLRVVNYAKENCERWEDTSQRSPTRGQLLSPEVLNLYHINEFVILPATKEDNCSCVELLASEIQDPDYFVSHWWGERVVQFLECINSHIKTKGKGIRDESFYWICAYANRQHSLSQEITADPRNTSFYRAMSIAKGLLLVLDGKNDEPPCTGPATPFSRSWCTFEVSMAVLELHKPIDVATCADGIGQVLTDGYTEEETKVEKKSPGWGSRSKSIRESTFPVEVMNAGLTLEIETAKASEESDRVRILNAISNSEDLDGEPLGSHQNYTKVNKRLASTFATACWFQVVQKDGIINPKQLAQALKHDEWRRSLTLNFGFCTKFDDMSLAILSSGLPKKLLRLELHFWMCNMISNAGLKAMVKTLPPDLETMTLNFQLCTKIGTSGVDALGCNLSPKLVSLRLSFEFDSGIRNIGSLSRGISNLTNLRVLDLDLGGIDSMDDNQAATMAEMLTWKLKNLYLSFKGCHFLTGKGVQSLARKLPTEMTVLNLNLSTCDRINNDAVKAIAYNLPKSLKVLHVNLMECSQIEDTAVALLVQRLPDNLVGCKINVIGTKVPENIQRACRRLETMRAWQMETIAFMQSQSLRVEKRFRPGSPMMPTPEMSGGTRRPHKGWSPSPTEVDVDVESARFATPTAASTARFSRSGSGFFLRTGSGSPTSRSQSQLFSGQSPSLDLPGTMTVNDLVQGAADAAAEKSEKALNRSNSAPVAVPMTPPSGKRTLPKIARSPTAA
mmetsp:Transcript_50803/g.91271  ORF Transcript_50803/g.91271 Transcript_50803/m.91271 type:complete len:772 (+) Transcript_50803:80-2395(+)